MDVSIIIVNWNTKDVLRNCLQSIYQQADKTKFEVIVIDNNSNDGSARMVAEEFPHVKLISNESNIGFAAANNQGILSAKGKYVLLLNPDTIILNGAITKAVAFADSNPRAAVVGCLVMNPDKSLQLSCFMFPSLLNMFLSATYLYKIFPKSRFFGRYLMSWWDHASDRAVEAVSGCFMLVRQEAINQVGILDERFFMYTEEADWCYRFRKAGWQIWHFAGAQVIHLRGESSKKRTGISALPLHGSLIKYMAKHHSPLKVALFCCLVSIHFGVRAPMWAVVALLRKKDRQESWKRCRMYMHGCLAALAGGRSLNIWKSETEANPKTTWIA
jgi:GT2 family glycosyltransferase